LPRIRNIAWVGMMGSACANAKPVAVYGLGGRVEKVLGLDKDQQSSRCQDKLRQWLIDNLDNASPVAGV
jgi:hypothetical protein